MKTGLGHLKKIPRTSPAAVIQPYCDTVKVRATIKERDLILHLSRLVDLLIRGLPLSFIRLEGPSKLFVN